MTIRNVGGIALFLLGTTYLWLTPSFVGEGVSTEGFLWGLTTVLSLATLLGFTVATWGLFTRHRWWERVAVGSAVLGLVVLVPYWVAADRAGETDPWWNVLVHAVGAGAVLVLLLVPSFEHRIAGHVAQGA